MIAWEGGQGGLKKIKLKSRTEHPAFEIFSCSFCETEQTSI